MSGSGERRESGQAAAAPVALLAGAAVALSAGGCYKRVVGERGVGARFSEQNIYEPNSKEKKESGPFKRVGD